MKNLFIITILGCGHSLENCEVADTKLVLAQDIEECREIAVAVVEEATADAPMTTFECGANSYVGSVETAQLRRQ